MAFVNLSDVSLTFSIRQSRRVALKEFLLQRLFLPSRNPMLQIRSLRNVNLQLRPGDRLGIIGANGAGKSSLLRVLAGIYPPTTGVRQAEGKISSLFDVTLGFEPESNGWENIAYRGYLQGETPASVREKSAAIAEFSELGPFMDVPVRHYSAGMLLRLAFSIATAIDPEVLLLDEVFGVGDLAFHRKARERLSAMLNRAKIVVMVGHDLHSIASFCDKIAWMDQGQIKQIGPANEVLASYSNASLSQPPMQAAA